MEKYTIKQIAAEAEVSERTVHNRANALGIAGTYERGYRNVFVRYFTEEEKNRIVGYKGEKPGRKKG